MVSESEGTIRQLLLDPAYWRPLLDRLDEVPRGLVLFPRPDLSRPGTEVLELRLRAFDGQRLRALLTRPAFGQEGEAVRLRPGGGVDPHQIDWTAVEEGHTDLSFDYPADRRLEERVLDVLRITDAACSIESVECLDVRNGVAECAHPPDELVIAELIRAKGWL